MEKKILKYKRVYRIFLILALIGFIDSFCIPIILKSFGHHYPRLTSDFIPGIAFITLGRVGAIVVAFFTKLWFFWFVVVFFINEYIRKMENKSKINIKNTWIFLGALIATFFINFGVLFFRLNQCGFGKWPCVSESGYIRLFTNYPNFLFKAHCNLNFGLECFPAHFSLGQLILDIVCAFLLSILILVIIRFFKRIFKKDLIIN